MTAAQLLAYAEHLERLADELEGLGYAQEAETLRAMAVTLRNEAAGDPDVHADFESRRVRPDCVAANSLRTPGVVNPFAVYVPGEDALVFTAPGGTNPPGIPSLYSVHVGYPYIDRNSGHRRLTIFCDFKFSREWVDIDERSTNLDGTAGIKGLAWKLFRNQLKKKPTGWIGNPYRMELRVDAAAVEGPGVACFPSMRTYDLDDMEGSSESGMSITTPNGEIDNQPSPEVSAIKPKGRRFRTEDHLASIDHPYLFLLEKWYRMRHETIFEGDVTFFRLTVSDKDRGPIVVVSNPEDSSRGFRTSDIDPVKTGSDDLHILWNTSSKGLPIEDFSLSVCDVTVHQGDDEVPLRPPQR